jgi:hypothetical protein
LRVVSGESRRTRSTSRTLYEGIRSFRRVRSQA